MNQNNISLEKVVKELARIREDHFGGMTSYEGEVLDEAIALLKKQEPVEPIFDYDGRDVWRCGNCHSNIFHPTRTDEDENEKNYRRFCFHCGKAVKWK